ncbi:MAG: hypothetical protein ACI9AD_001643 [Nitriliruptoraceae bacterium]|jgi:hypothetical protein
MEAHARRSQCRAHRLGEGDVHRIGRADGVARLLGTTASQARTLPIGPSLVEVLWLEQRERDARRTGSTAAAR